MEKICEKGHRYTKKSDCPTCPVCEVVKTGQYFVKLSAPAMRALCNVGIYSVRDLAAYTEKEILAMHGIGKSSLPVLRDVLLQKGMAFKK